MSMKAALSKQQLEWIQSGVSNSGSDLVDDGGPVVAKPSTSRRTSISSTSSIDGLIRRVRNSISGGANRREFEDGTIKRRENRCKTVVFVLERIIAEHGRRAQIALLLCLGAIQVWVYGLAWALLVWRYEEEVDPRPEERVSRYIEGFWAAWTFMSDGGTHARFYHAEQRFLGGAISASGIIYLNIVLAVVVDMVRERMNSMRVGKGALYEEGHTLIVNWSDKAIPLIHELCMANACAGGGVIVVLAKDSIEAMKIELETQLPSRLRYKTRVTFRHGSPAVVSDLIKVCAEKASATIILASEKLHKDEADASTLRCILSLQSMGYSPQGHFVAEVLDIDNENLTKVVGRRYVETFVSHDVLGRLMLMSVRQMGLASVWDELLGFQGNEFYVQAWPELIGADFKGLLGRFPDAIPVGIFCSSGELLINPPEGITLGEGDEVIVVAQDENSYAPKGSELVEIEMGDIPPPAPVPTHKEKILICGWRRDIRNVLVVLDLQAPAGSEVHIMTHSMSAEERNEVLAEEGLDVSMLKRISLFHIAGNTSVRRRLETIPLETYSSCIIFADQAYENDDMAADSHSLATLVLIRDIQASRLEHVTCPITCEVLDARTHRMIVRQKSLILLSDFVQSNRFVARILAMVSKQRRLKAVLEELLGARGNSGSSLSIMPSSWVVAPDERLSFWIVAKRVASHNAILLGYQEISGSKTTILNPRDKDEDLFWESLDLAVIATDVRQKEEEAPVDESGPGRRSHVRGSKKKKSLTTTDAAPLLERHTTIDWEALNLAEDTSSEDGSPDAATGDVLKLASRFLPLMSTSDQQRFGTALVHLSEVVKQGNFPMTCDAGA